MVEQQQQQQQQQPQPQPQRQQQPQQPQQQSRTLPKTICFDTSHRELFTPSSGLKMLRRRLNTSYKITTNSEPLTLSRLRECQLLAVVGPRARFSRAELEALEAFLNEGGSLLIRRALTTPVLPHSPRCMTTPFSRTVHAVWLADDVNHHHCSQMSPPPLLADVTPSIAPTCPK